MVGTYSTAGIANYQGTQYARDGSEIQVEEYKVFNTQYATTSHGIEHDMNPARIFKPKHDEDIMRIVKWATEQKRSIAVKSGGHQYSGACSTGGRNVQIDLGETYQDLQVLNDNGYAAPDRAYVLVGVSNRLKYVLAYLKGVGLFVPTGQCAYVAVGGHGQTGGYGQMGRSFGLFGDHIRAIRLIDHNSELRTITKETDAELFHAILGGSPGNFGIITHYTLEVYKASSYLGKGEGYAVGDQLYKGPHMMKALFVYDKEILRELLEILAHMSDRGDTPRGFDYCLSVLSSQSPITAVFPELQEKSKWETFQHQVTKAVTDTLWDWIEMGVPACIVVYASWCPTSEHDRYDETVDRFFQKFRHIQKQHEVKSISIASIERDTTMAEMPLNWVFQNEREFDLPYVKRTYTTNSLTLVDDKWPEEVSERIDLIYNLTHKINAKDNKEYQTYDQCKLAVQIQCFGGTESRFYQNRHNGTSYSWRDSTVVQVLDCFYKSDGRDWAETWQKENDAIFNNEAGPFSKKDRRVLWGSWGDWDMSKPEVWQTYYEDKEKYERIGRARGRADPNGTFTANPFAVKAIHEPLLQRIGERVATGIDHVAHTHLANGIVNHAHHHTQDAGAAAPVAHTPSTNGIDQHAESSTLHLMADEADKQVDHGVNGHISNGTAIDTTHTVPHSETNGSKDAITITNEPSLLNGHVQENTNTSEPSVNGIDATTITASIATYDDKIELNGSTPNGVHGHERNDSGVAATQVVEDISGTTADVHTTTIVKAKQATETKSEESTLEQTIDAVHNVAQAVDDKANDVLSHWTNGQLGRCYNDEQ